MGDLHTGLPPQSYPGPSLPGPDDVRFISLLPGSQGEEIICELVVTKLGSAPPYEALSYTWGDPSDRQTVSVKIPASGYCGHLPVTSNCFQALRRLRLQDRPRMLWIDAMCIDQENFSERNHQLALMSRIYSQACEVVIYLGEAAHNSDLALDFISEIHAPTAGYTSLSYPKSDSLIHALTNFFRRPWFTRIWSTSLRGVDIATSFSTNSFESAMLKALHEARHCEASDPRDKVYGLLPLLHSPGKPAAILPSYADTTAKVFVDCAMSLMDHCGFEILSAVQSRSTTADLPSWVPDWSVPPKRMVLGAPGSSAFSRCSMASFWKKDRVAGTPEDTKPSTQLVDCNGASSLGLRVVGIFRGTIASISSTYHAGQGTFPLSEWMKLLSHRAVQELGGKRGVPLHLQGAKTELEYVFFRVLGAAGFAYPEALERFLGLKRNPYAYDNGSGREGSHATANNAFDRIIREIALAGQEGPSKERALSFAEIPFHQAAREFPQSYAAYVRYVLQHCHSRRFFVTDSGYIGVAPEEAQVGDQVYLCVGAGFPFVMRKTEHEGLEDPSFHQLVGECYAEERIWRDLEGMESATAQNLTLV